jgi:hypothetical protein
MAASGKNFFCNRRRAGELARPLLNVNFFM